MISEARTRASHNFLGVTHPQTCLVLGARLRALPAGFRVILVSSPGELLTASPLAKASSGSQFQYAVASLRSRIWFAATALEDCSADAGHGWLNSARPKQGCWGRSRPRLRGVPCRVYMLRGLKLERSTGFKRRILLAPKLAAACAQVVLCNSESLRAEALCTRSSACRQAAHIRRRKQQWG